MRASTGMWKLTCLLIGAWMIALCCEASAQSAGWSVPATAKDEKNPLTASPEILAKGKEIFVRKCERCHGPEGKGNGPEAEPQILVGDLSDEFRAPLNPEGVMFYRVLNGRPPTMPAFKEELKKDEIWTVVEYAKSLRKPS